MLFTKGGLRGKRRGWGGRVLTNGRVHFGPAALDVVLGGATSVADIATHLMVALGLGTVGQAVAGLPAVEAQLQREFKTI